MSKACILLIIWSYNLNVQKWKAACEVLHLRLQGLVGQTTWRCCLSLQNHGIVSFGKDVSRSLSPTIN